MDISWDDVRIVLAVAQTGSVSGAARSLQLGQPTVSRRLGEIEAALGTRLFARAVKGTTPTAAGERLLHPARKMAEWATELARQAEATDAAPSGLVRLTAAPFTCFDFLAPFAGWLRGKQPGLRLEVLSSARYLDLGRGEADLALRFAHPVGRELVVLEELHYENAAWASRQLAKRLPKRPHPRDVPWIGWAPPFEDQQPQPALRRLIPDFEPAFASDNILVNLAAAEAGAGAIVLSRVRHRFSRPTRMVPLQLELGAAARGTLCLVCAKSALEIPRVRLVADLLRAELKSVTHLRKPA